MKKPFLGMLVCFGLFIAICYTAPAAMTIDNAPALMLLVLVGLIFAAGFFFWPVIMNPLDLRQVADNLQQPAQTPKGQMVNPQQFGSFPWEQ